MRATRLGNQITCIKLHLPPLRWPPSLSTPKRSELPDPLALCPPLGLCARHVTYAPSGALSTATILALNTFFETYPRPTTFFWRCRIAMSAAETAIVGDDIVEFRVIKSQAQAAIEKVCAKQFRRQNV